MQLTLNKFGASEKSVYFDNDQTTFYFEGTR